MTKTKTFNTDGMLRVTPVGVIIEASNGRKWRTNLIPDADIEHLVGKNIGAYCIDCGDGRVIVKSIWLIIQHFPNSGPPDLLPPLSRYDVWLMYIIIGMLALLLIYLHIFPK